MAARLVRVNPVTVNDVLDGHVKLDLDCLDRVYLHGYLGQLQVGGQVVQFLRHRGFPVPSPACLQQIGDGFRRSVASFADANHIPVVRLKSTDRNGPVVAALQVTEESDVMIITEYGKVIRVHANEIREAGRSTQGVRLLRLEDGDKIAAAASILEDQEVTEEKK